MKYNLINTDNYLLVVDDSEIQKGDCYLSPSGIWFYNHLNPNHNKESKKVCAHLPINGSPILEGVDLLPPYSRHQEDGVEELAQEWYDKGELTSAYSFKAGYNKAREKYKYTEEDVRYLIMHSFLIGADRGHYSKEIEDRIIQSLQQSKYPISFECEMERVFKHNEHMEREFYEVPKTIINSENRTEWVGKYIYE
jgi:hypothetical protein